MEEYEKPAWLETLWNINPSLAERAEKDVINWQKLEKLHSGGKPDSDTENGLHLADVHNSVCVCQKPRKVAAFEGKFICCNCNKPIAN